MFTVVQISDTHLSSRITRFNDNWAAAARSVVSLDADLLIHTGDASLDGPDNADDLHFAARTISSGLGMTAARMRCVPGNHDVGDRAAIAPSQPTTDARVVAHEAALGPACWIEDAPGWRLVGINTQVMGTGVDAEAAQEAMLAEAALTLGERRLALFMHKPPFIDAADEGDGGYWTVPPAARAPLMPLLDHPHLRLVATGHLHVMRIVQRGRAVHAWAPATSFMVGEQLMPDTRGGTRCLGLFRHRFGTDQVETDVIAIPDAEPIVLDPILASIYPPTA